MDIATVVFLSLTVAFAATSGALVIRLGTLHRQLNQAKEEAKLAVVYPIPVRQAIGELRNYLEVLLPKDTFETIFTVKYRSDWEGRETRRMGYPSSDLGFRAVFRFAYLKSLYERKQATSSSHLDDTIRTLAGQCPPPAE